MPARIYVVLLRGPRQTLAASHCLRSIYPVKRTRVPQDMSLVPKKGPGMLEGARAYGTQAMTYLADLVAGPSSSTEEALKLTATQCSIENTKMAIREGALDKDSRNLLTAIIHQWSFLFDEKETLLDRYRTLYELLLKCESIRKEYVDHSSDILHDHDFVQDIIEYDCLLLMYVGFLKRNKSQHDTANFSDIEAWYCFLRNWSKFEHVRETTQKHFGKSLNIHNILLTQSEDAQNSTDTDANEIHLKILVTDILMHERRTNRGKCQEQEKIVHNLLFQLELTLDTISYEPTVQSNMLSMNKGNPLDMNLVLTRLVLVLKGVSVVRRIAKEDDTDEKIKKLLDALDAISATIEEGCIFSNQMIQNMQVLYQLAISVHDDLDFTPSKTEILDKADGQSTFEDYHDKYGAYSIYFMYLKIQHKGKIKIKHEKDTSSSEVITNDEDLFDKVFEPKSSWTTTILYLADDFVAKMKATDLRDLCGVFKQDPKDFYRRRNILLGKNGFDYNANSALNESEQYHVHLTQFSQEKKGVDGDIACVWNTLTDLTKAQTLSAVPTADEESKILEVLKHINKDPSKSLKFDFLLPDNKYWFFGDLEGVTDDMMRALNCMAAYCVRATLNSARVTWDADPDYYFHKRSMISISDLHVRETLDHAFRRMRIEPLIMNSTIAEKMKEDIPFLNGTTVDIEDEKEEQKVFLLWIQLACKIQAPSAVEICDVVGAWKDGLDTEYKNSTVDNAFKDDDDESSDEIATRFRNEYNCKQGTSKDGASKAESYGQPLLKQTKIERVEKSAPPPTVDEKTAKLEQLEILYKEFEEKCYSPNSSAQHAFEQVHFSVSDYSEVLGMERKSELLASLLNTLNRKTGDHSTGDSMSVALTTKHGMCSKNLSNKPIQDIVDFRGLDNSEHFKAAKNFYDFLCREMALVIAQKYPEKTMKGALMRKFIELHENIISCHNLTLPETVPLDKSDTIDDIPDILLNREILNGKINGKVESINQIIAQQKHATNDDAPDIVYQYCQLLERLKKIMNQSFEYLQQYVKKVAQKKTYEPTASTDDNFFLQQAKEKSDFVRKIDSIVKKIEEEIPEDGPGKAHYLGAASEAAFGNDNLEPEPQAWAPHSASAAGTYAAGALRIPCYPFPQIMPPYTLEPQRWAYGPAGTGNFLPVRPAHYSTPPTQYSTPTAQYSTPTAPFRITPDGTHVYVVYLH